MKDLVVILFLVSTGIAGLASTNVAFLNDTLTISEGAQRNVQIPAIRTVVIDPGHGGRDEGCSGAHSEEKEIALQLGLALGRRIESYHPEIEVIYTRETDKFVALYERARIANKAQADLFISIHCNYMVGHSSVNGSETYVMGLHTADHNLNVAKRENEVVRMEQDVNENYSFDPNTPAGHITLSMFQHAFQEQSIAAAQHIERRLGEREGRKSRGVRMAGFVVLKETAMPSVLVETGYLSNEDEENYLTETTTQLRTVDALYDGFADYLRARNREERGDNPVLASQKLESLGHNEIPLLPDSKTVDKLTGSSTSPFAEPDASTPAPAFFVQLAAAKTQVDTDKKAWKSLGVPIRVVREGAYLKYQAGPFETLAQANTMKNKAKKQGFPDAFSLGYLGEKKLSPSQLKIEE